MQQQQQIDWHRAKVLELSSQGHSEREIAQTLLVGTGTVHRDSEDLRQQAEESLKTHVQERLPEEYQHCITGMKQVLRLSWEIVNSGHHTDNGLNSNNSNRTIMESDKTSGSGWSKKIRLQIESFELAYGGHHHSIICYQNILLFHVLSGSIHSLMSRKAIRYFWLRCQ
jgi:hypothetical protein